MEDMAGANINSIIGQIKWEKEMTAFTLMHQLPRREIKIPCISGKAHYWIESRGVFSCRYCESVTQIPVVTVFEPLRYGGIKGGCSRYGIRGNKATQVAGGIR